jgi:hypothetical protein
VSSENELGAAGTPLPTPPPPPPPQVHKRHLLRKIVLTVLAVIVLGFVAFMALGFYEVHKNAASTQAGAAPANAPAPPSAPDFGIPMYPGATLTAAGVQTTVNSNGTTLAAVYSTPDSPTLVAQFYQQQLGSAVQVMNMPGGAIMMSMGTPGNATSVIVTVANGETHINIDHGLATAQ